MSVSTPQVAVLIPTFNNYRLLNACLMSVIGTNNNGIARYYVLNNGHPDLKGHLDLGSEGEVINFGKNLGWEGALAYGVEHTTEPYLMFLNDDIHAPPHTGFWISSMLACFRDPTIGAMGPISNAILGEQNMFYGNHRYELKTVKYLIGMCFLVRREALIKAGGIDTTGPGGDDLDLSIRLRDLGYKLLVDRSVYLHHHAFQTGQRVHGSYWNSDLMQDRTNNWLIRKHGVKKFLETISGGSESYFPPETLLHGNPLQTDLEGEICASLVTQRPVLELGVGGRKTVPDAVGVDLVPPGEKITTIHGTISRADIVSDVRVALPVPPESQGTILARHILEHCIDPIATLKVWMTVLKPGGQMVIAVPDQDLHNTIPMNPEHVHAYTKDSLRSLLEAVGLRVTHIQDTQNSISFIVVAEKPKAVAPVYAEPEITVTGDLVRA